MITCTGCGGIVGRDCFSPQRCELKSLDQQRRATKSGADARIADLETALRAAQATIGGLEMEVARLTVEAGKSAQEAEIDKSIMAAGIKVVEATGMPQGMAQMRSGDSVVTLANIATKPGISS